MALVGSGPLVALPVLLPLAGAVAAFVLGSRWVGAVAALVAVGVPSGVAALTVLVVRRGPLVYPVGGVEAPLGIELHVDGLGAVMLAMTAVVMAITGPYAAAYYAGARRGGYFWPLWMFLWAALDAVFISGDVFNVYVGLELVGLSAVASVALAGGRRAVAAGMRYLLVSIAGSLAFLLGVALLYGAYGTLGIAELGGRVSPGPASWVALALTTLGMALKTALFPFHFWLPPAHASAPAPVSALLSGLVVKASFYVVLRLWFDVFPPVPAAGQLLGLLGSAAILYGSVEALRRRRLKVVVAFSTVAQIGYLFLLFPLAAPTDWGAGAWASGAYGALSHACAKAAMFMAAGAVLQTVGHDAVGELAGLARRLPAAVAAFAVAGWTLVGLPPSGAKTLLAEAALRSGQWWFVVVIAAGSLLTAGYVLRVLRRAFGRVSRTAVAPPKRPGMELPALALALCSLAVGLASGFVLDLLSVGSPFA